MDLTTELKKPSYSSEPDFVTNITNGEKFYSFNCAICENPNEIDFQRQIEYNWSGKTELISNNEWTELKKHYGIGLSGKSHDGGFPVFDKLHCKKCGQEYLTYCGVREFSNSDYSIFVHGIIRK